jgi:hypothetical protein
VGQHGFAPISGISSRKQAQAFGTGCTLKRGFKLKEEGKTSLNIGLGSKK